MTNPLGARVQVNQQDIKRLLKKFDKAKTQAKDQNVLIVYTANYALWVHEMVGANFQRPGAEAKFLEKALRRTQPQILSLLETHLKKDLTLGKSLYLVGLNVLRTSNSLVPIDTGNLRATGTVRMENTNEQFQFTT